MSEQPAEISGEVSGTEPGYAPHAGRDVLLAAALDELRSQNEQLLTAQTAREAELEAAVAHRTAELEAAHAAAAREHERLRDLVERLQDGIVMVNRDLEIEFANAAARRHLADAGVAPGAPLPDPWPDMSLRALAAGLFEPAAGVAEAHVVSTSEHALYVTGLPSRGTAAVLVLADISARERREQAEREFVVNAAHELRTPLAAISTAVEVLRSGARHDPAQRDRFLGHIERQCARLGRIAEALLTLARAQMGIEQPRFEIVEVRPLLQQVAGDVRPARAVRISVDCPAGLAVFGHPELLQQAVANLAENAAKHTSRGTIALRCIRSEDWIAIEVADTGTGMNEEDRSRATERFFRTGREPGVGLGLAIASQVAAALGGRLELESVLGKGTTARIVLPSAEVLARG